MFINESSNAILDSPFVLSRRSSTGENELHMQGLKQDAVNNSAIDGLVQIAILKVIPPSVLIVSATSTSGAIQLAR